MSADLRDEVGGRRHQQDVRAHREEAEAGPDDDPAATRRGQGEEAADDGHGASTESSRRRYGPSRAARSAGGPAWTIRPASRTRPRRRPPPAGAGARRRATVRPCAASRPTASRMTVSLSASRCEVASSRMTSRASARNARAIARRWRWPPLSRSPPSPSGVSKPRGRASMKRSAPASRAAARRSSSVASGRASRRLSATVPWKRYGTLRDPGDVCPPGRDVDARRAACRRRGSVPASGSMNRRSRFATVVLPAPVAPTRARRPGPAEREVEVVEGRRRRGPGR